MIADRSEPIQISKRIRGCEGLVFGGAATDRHRASRRIVDIGNRRGRPAGHTLRRAVSIRVACDHTDSRTDIGIAQLIGRC